MKARHSCARRNRKTKLLGHPAAGYDAGRIIEADYADLTSEEAEGMPEFKSQEELDAYIVKLENDMREAAKRFEFEKAAKLRDTIKELRTKEFLFA